MTLGEKIQSLRGQLGMSQKDLAQLIGCKTGVVAEWEADETVPSLSELSKLSKALDVSSDVLLDSTIYNHAAIPSKSNSHTERRHSFKLNTHQYRWLLRSSFIVLTVVISTVLLLSLSKYDLGFSVYLGIPIIVGSFLYCFPYRLIVSSLHHSKPNIKQRTKEVEVKQSHPETTSNSTSDTSKKTPSLEDFRAIYERHETAITNLLNQNSYEVTQQFSIEIDALLYVIADLAVIASKYNRNYTSWALLFTIESKHLQKYATFSKDVFQSRGDFYGSVIRNRLIHAHCFPNKSLCDNKPTLRCAAAFCDCLMYTPYITNYETNGAPIFDAVHALNVASNILQPLNSELVALYNEIFRLTVSQNHATASPPISASIDQNKSVSSSDKQQQETGYYMEAIDGSLVRVPEGKVESWSREQERQKNRLENELSQDEWEYEYTTTLFDTNKNLSHTDLNATHIFKKRILSMFHFSKGHYAALDRYIIKFIEEVNKHSLLTEEDRWDFFRQMYRYGEVRTANSDSFIKENSYILDGLIYIPEHVQLALEDDWIDTRNKATAAGICLVTHSNCENGNTIPGINIWNDALAKVMPDLFDAGDDDLVASLEKIVALAECYSSDNISLAGYICRILDNEYTTEDDLLEEIEQQMIFTLLSLADSLHIDAQITSRTEKEIRQERWQNRVFSRLAKERCAVKKQHQLS